MKRGAIVFSVLFFLLSILAISTVTADHAATLAITPLEQYETTAAPYGLTVNNFGSTDVLTRILVTIGPGTIVGAVSYGGWQSNISTNVSNTTNTTLLWHSGTVETNVLNALFEFLVRAGRVDTDASATMAFDTIDRSGFTQTHTFSWQIWNDASGPILEISQPIDGMLLLQSAPLPLSANASDNETGVRNVSLNWRNCTNTTNATGQPSGVVALTASGSAYAGTLDLSAFRNEQRICFDYRAESNGDARTTSSGVVTIDGEAPMVVLLTPFDGATMNSQTDFNFIPDDNLAPQLTCTLVVDGSDTDTDTFSPGLPAQISTADAPEGTHGWSVRCTDTVGLMASSATRSYFLDRTPPAITVNQPQNAVLREGTEITIATSDNYQLRSTNVTIGNTTTNTSNSTVISTTGLAEGEHLILIQATDAAGNAASLTYTYFIDKSPPVLTLLGPATGNTGDVFASFLFTAIDTYDPIVDCTLYLNDHANASTNATNQTQNLTVYIAPGSYVWYVQCLDDARNAIASETRSLDVIDTSGPNVQISPIGLLVRGHAAILSATIDDYSGVASTSAILTAPDGSTTPLTLTAVSNVYAASIPTAISSPLGTYTITLTATDTGGYATMRTVDFTVTYGYALSISLIPTNPASGGSVQLLGSLAYDNGSQANDTQVNITLPGSNATVNTTNGTFTHSFTAPSDGIYIVGASTVALNGVEFTATATLTVTSSSANSGNSGGIAGFGSSNGGGSGSGGSSGGRSSAGTSGQGSSGGTSTASSADSGTSSTESGDSDSGGQTVASDGDSGGQIVPVSAPAPAIGVGQAIGFFNLDALKNNRMAWTIAALAILLAVLFILGMKGHFHRNVETEEEGLTWDSYLDRLKNR